MGPSTGPTRPIYHIAVENGENGWFVAQAQELPGAITQGRDLDELAFMIRDAIELRTDEKKFQIDLMLPKALAQPKRRAG